MMTVRCPPIDRISNLPSNLIETILMLLPLRDAVRTSVLSKKWRYNWVKLPQLVFDDTLIKNSDWDWPFVRYLNEIELSPERRLIKVIYHVLLLHNGPILKFTLSTSQIERCSEIDLFIVFLSRNGVEEFTFGISKCQCYVLPLSFFSCSRLRHLKLSHCEFDPPRTFNGFSRLVSLEFNRVDIRESVLGSLVSSCPLLEQLTLNGSYSHFEFEDPFDFEYIEIRDAPNLKFLSISAIFGSVRFKNTPRLAVVSITSDNSDDLKLLNEKEAPEMIHVFSCLPVIETLQLGYRFVKFLTVAGVPQRLLFTLDHLKVLQLYDICFGEIVNVSFLLCLIKSSPNLKRIEIEVRRGPAALMIQDLF
ncbi:F-box/FBD/LRR-repeat protein At1g13570-like isoform X2 [Cornus florida]|uniref:F-box/FBD/LRR-repeat protein At1g13570-like isoform X2 n=1 Tax=Cornus florida TaxID=4283 RepID=UPI00289F99B0|nr:F-box/FBD/LRR-repeat protein At1g13570-like isoform X2 [Cornus florida]